MTLYKDPGYDLVKDFAPAAMLTTSPFILAIHPSVKAATLQEFIALAKATPGKLNYGSPGVGAGGHMSGELLKSMAGIDITHVPYKGAAQAITALVAAEVQAVFNAASTSMPLISTGKVSALGVSSRRPSPLAPGIAPISDLGVPGFESIVWQGIEVRVGTPAAVPMRINREVNVLLGNAEFKEQLFKQGVEPEPMTPEAFGGYIKTEVEKWAHVIKKLGITAE
jgi:tripartite-type tricarboxylate transporter receptor subunit TctC